MKYIKIDKLHYELKYIMIDKFLACLQQLLGLSGRPENPPGEVDELYMQLLPF